MFDIIMMYNSLILIMLTKNIETPKNYRVKFVVEVKLFKLSLNFQNYITINFFFIFIIKKLKTDSITL